MMGLLSGWKNNDPLMVGYHGEELCAAAESLSCPPQDLVCQLHITGNFTFWLGHESVETISVYLHADLQLKQEAMAKTSPAGLPPHRYQPNDEVLAFLDSL